MVGGRGEGIHKDQPLKQFSRQSPLGCLLLRLHERLAHLACVLPFSVTLPEWTTRDLHVLLDSGAHVNLVRRGLLDPPHVRTNSQPVRLKVANGTPMIGGTEEANLSLQFWQSHSPQVDSSTTCIEFSDVFY